MTSSRHLRCNLHLFTFLRVPNLILLTSVVSTLQPFTLRAKVSVVPCRSWRIEISGGPISHTGFPTEDLRLKFLNIETESSRLELNYILLARVGVRVKVEKNTCDDLCLKFPAKILFKASFENTFSDLYGSTIKLQVAALVQDIACCVFIEKKKSSCETT